MPIYKRTCFKCCHKQKLLFNSNWCSLLNQDCFGPEDCEWAYKKIWDFYWEMDCGNCDERWNWSSDSDCFKCEKVQIKDISKIRWK